MTINASVPVGTDLVSSLDSYIRDDRAQINLLWAAITAANCTYTAHEMTAGEFEMEIGVDLEDVILETVGLTGSVAVNLIQISGGSSGMVKILKAGDGNVTVKHDTSYIDLSGDADLTLTAGNTLILVNIGGDPDTSANGIWYELARSGSAVGEVNTASNVGTGAGDVYKQKTGVDLELKTILAGSGISVTNNVSDITIAATGGVAGQISFSSTNMAAAQTALVTGVDLSNVINEIVYLTADVAVDLTTMTGGLAGAIKTIIAADSDVTVIQDKAATAGGTFSLNSPAGDDLAMSVGDVLTVVNISGDGAGVDGYWWELYRTLRV